MQVDDVAGQHDDTDNDSLFGSPPPSPGRGRSPSLLEFPRGQNNVQNVGTLALPGSHLCSEFNELPSAPPLVPPAARRSVAQPSPQEAQQSRATSATPRPATPLSRSASAPRKTKRVRKRAAPAVDAGPPPITLPSPTDPPPANFLRNQQALLGLAGLVGGVNPANLSMQRHTRGESPNNPIVVEDDRDTPMIGRRPVYHPGFLPGPLPVPSAQEVLSTLVKQRNLYPIVDALVRMVSSAGGPHPHVPSSLPSTPVAGPSNPPTYISAYQYPYHPYQYAYPYYYSYPYQYPHPYVQGYSSMPGAPPPVKKRKLTDVPAGAADWDVPYPFAAGQGPPGYHSNWGRQRQQQLLDDLVGLIKSAAKKAAAKKAISSPKEEPSNSTIGSVEYYKERVLRHYRPQTNENRNIELQVQTQSDSSTAVDANSVQSPSSATQGSVQALPPMHTDASSPPEELSGPQISQSSSESSTPLPPASTTHDFEPMTPARLVSEEASVFPPISPEVTAGGDTSTAPDLDELLALFNDISAGELDALFASTVPSQPAGSSSTTAFDSATFPDLAQNAQGSTTNASTTSSEADTAAPVIDPSLFSMDPSLLVIDPQLLAASFPPEKSYPAFSSTQGEQSRLQSVVASAGSPSPTPTLAHSPISLSDLDPPTPNWDILFPEPDVVLADGESGTNERVQSHSSQGGRTDATDGLQPGGLPSAQDKGKGRATEVGMYHAMDGFMDASSSGHSTTESTPLPWAIPATQEVTLNTANDSHVPPTAPLQPFPLPSSRPNMTQLTMTTPANLRTVKSVPSARPLLSLPKNKDDIVRRAKAMRAQIVEEIERAKVELWATTMEGGCLAVLAKERDKGG